MNLELFLSIYKSNQYIINHEKHMNEGKEFEVLKVNRYEIEENAVFLDYTLTTLLQEIQNFKETTIYVRQSMSKNLRAIEEVLHKENKDAEFFQLLQKMAHDNEEIQMEVVHYLKEEKQRNNIDKFYRDKIEQPLMGIAKGPYLEIKEQACSILSELAHQLQPQQKQQIIIFAKQLAATDDEQNKIVSLQLLAKLGQDIDIDQKKQIFKQLFLATYSSASVRVKKQIIIQIGRLSSYLDHDFVQENIVQNFFTKEAYQSAWGIRKSCVEILTTLLHNITNKKNILANILLQLLKDGNKFVRIAAHKIVPEFLAKYGDAYVPDKLFEIYLGMIDLDINNQVSKLNEIIVTISYYFPGVLYTVGGDKWSKMKQLFNRLLRFKSQDVKMPLASSLHVIGKIIGPEKSKQDLFPALDFILKDPSDRIKLKAIQHLAKFVEQFDKITRQNLIDVFLVLQKDPKKWRVRYSIASQLNDLSKLYDAETIFKYILPISLKLCNDNVSQVRNAATHQIIYVLEHLKAEQQLYLMAIQSIKGYALSQKYIQRQTFCLMLSTLYDNQESFMEKYRQELDLLVSDKNPLVRITMAISMRELILERGCKSKQMLEYAKQLCKDAQVEQYLQQVLE